MRPARAADVATLKGLLHDEGHGGEWPGFAEACHSGKDQESICVLVAEQEGSVAGMAILAPRQSIWEGQRLFLRMLLTRSLHNCRPTPLPFKRTAIHEHR